MRSGSRPDARGVALVALFSATSALGSALLFAVQPMVARALLPVLGGAPAVWIVASATFQALLLAGYLAAHASAGRLGPRAQLLGELTLLAAGALAVAHLPAIAAAGGPASGVDPALWLVGRLLAVVGAPFLAIATTSPILQRAYARGGGPSADDPYFLYAASNLGGLGALLAYPTWVEPTWPLSAQWRAWGIGYLALAALILACAIAARDRGRARPAPTPDATAKPPAGSWWAWMLLAFVPSSLTLGVTNYLTTDVAPIPLLWAIPLAIYLLTFVAAFSLPRAASAWWVGRSYSAALVALSPALATGLVQVGWVPIHLLAFGLAALLCHGRLASIRPGVGSLTSFYLAVSLGGVLGATFNAAVAPRCFDRLAEYPLMLVTAGLAIPGIASEAGRMRSNPSTWLIPAIVFGLTLILVLDLSGAAGSAWGALGLTTAAGLGALAIAGISSRPLRLVLTVGALLFAAGLGPGVAGRPLLRGRSFYGTFRVTQDDRAGLRRLFHGNTLHGVQSTDPTRRREPLGYFDRTGPIGDVFARLRDRPGPRRVAVVGLGVGALAAYAEAGDRWTLYELDPSVIRVADDPAWFRFLSDARDRGASVDLVAGDARLRLASAQDGSVDLLILDAFGSDSVPVHLLTREAARLDLRKLSPGGLLVFQATNRDLDLESVLAETAVDLGLSALVRRDVAVSKAEASRGKQGSIWVVMARDRRDLGALSSDPSWSPPRRRAGAHAWTDDYSDVIGALNLRRRFGR